MPPSELIVRLMITAIVIVVGLMVIASFVVMGITVSELFNIGYLSSWLVGVGMLLGFLLIPCAFFAVFTYSEKQPHSHDNPHEHNINQTDER